MSTQGPRLGLATERALALAPAALALRSSADRRGDRIFGSRGDDRIAARRVTTWFGSLAATTVVHAGDGNDRVAATSGGRRPR